MCAVAVLETATPRDEAVREATSAKVLAGKRALVTGGSRGIGKAIALALAEAGAAVAINYQRSVEAADEVCRAVCKFGVQGNIFQADVFARGRGQGHDRGREQGIRRDRHPREQCGNHPR